MKVNECEIVLKKFGKGGKNRISAKPAPPINFWLVRNEKTSPSPFAAMRILVQSSYQVS